MKGPLASFPLGRRPVIGLIPYAEQERFGPWDHEGSLVPVTYIDQIEAAGAVPVVISPCADANATVGVLDGVVLPGKSDVDPSVYRARRPLAAHQLRTGRDAWKIAVSEAARRRGIPALGICRGMQLLNIACGGDSVQALEDTAHAGPHRAQLEALGSQRVRIETDSWCGSVLGESATVPPYRHEPMRTLGSGVRAVAWAEDGCIEAIEGCEGALLVGLQWHPDERELSTLLTAFAEACSEVEWAGSSEPINVVDGARCRQIERIDFSTGDAFDTV